MTNVTNIDDHRKGWVCLHRRIMDNPLFRDNPDARHLFTDLLVLAAWADTEQDWRGKPITIARGQVMISTRRLAKLVGISHQSARTIIAHMVQHNIVKINTPNSTHPSVITICNFGKYQDKQHNENTTDNTALTQRQHSANTQKNKETNKQSNKGLSLTRISIEKKLREAAGASLDCMRASLHDIDPIMGLIEGGLDLDTDILPAIRAKAERSRPGSMRGWKPFAMAVEDSVANRKFGKDIAAKVAKPKRLMTPEEAVASVTMVCEYALEEERKALRKKQVEEACKIPEGYYD
jgi:hypothetical protein